MTIESIGYDGAINEQQWARLAGYLGLSPCVADAAAWKVSAVVGPDRTVRIAVGSGYADGILDTSDAAVDVQLDTIASGTRWDAIVARRDWTPTPGGGTSFTKVAGTTAQALPAGLLATPGVNADQVLALVQLTAGQSTPTTVINMAATPTNAVTYPSVLALPAGAPMGATADVAGRQHTKGPSAWAPSAPRTRTGTTTVTHNASGIAILTFSPPLSFTPAVISLTPILTTTALGVALNAGASLSSVSASIRAWRLTNGLPYAGNALVQWNVTEASA